MIGNIIIIVVALILSIPCFIFGIATIKDIPALGIQFIIYGLIIAGIAAKIIGV